ncbi:hypothetical protein PG994_007156 [Apiospora phragmitis]|uniref:Uncharacterized protein n=1 Tax=Apiospora phragmitis TaxID=2905665 RepID=A0ABR1V3B5_9PEZI
MRSEEELVANLKTTDAMCRSLLNKIKVLYDNSKMIRAKHLKKVQQLKDKVGVLLDASNSSGPNTSTLYKKHIADLKEEIVNLKYNLEQLNEPDDALEIKGGGAAVIRVQTE